MSADKTTLRTIAYVSEALEAFNRQALSDLFIRAQLYNDGVDVTGLLLFGDGLFVQTFEGPDESVERVYERIVEDSRHQIARVFMDESIQQRVYPAWAMMGDLNDPNPTLTTFLLTRIELGVAPFTHQQMDSLIRTVDFIEHQRLAPWVADALR